MAQPNTSPTTEEIYAARVPKPVEQLLFEVRKIIVGQDRLLERVLVALLSSGHILVEGVPGLAKTATVRAFAAAIGGKFGRIQFTPDLVPSDLVGTRVFNPRKADFSTELGPIFCNLLLADEVNRAPAKVQSALLEVMQERQVTIAKETFRVDEPFLVLATQNPIEADGTYPLCVKRCCGTVSCSAMRASPTASPRTTSCVASSNPPRCRGSTSGMAVSSDERRRRRGRLPNLEVLGRLRWPVLGRLGFHTW